MINPNWTWRPLGDLFAIGAGKTMSEDARTGPHKVPFLRTSNVLWDEIDLTDVDEMSIAPYELVGKRLKPGDLLVCEGGDIGRAAVWSGEREVMSFQNHLHRLRPLVPDVEPRFYVYFLQSAFTQLGIFEGAGNKTTIPNLSRNRLAALEVPVPPIAEQRSIVAALARAREAVKSHDLSLALAQELERAAMRELFTRGLRDERQRETEVGLVPESWVIRRFSDVVILQRGFDLPVAARRKGDVVVYGSNGPIGAHDHAPSGIPGQGLMVGRSGSVGKVSFSNGPYWPLNTTLYTADYRGNDPLWIRYWLEYFDLSRFGQGVSVPTLNRNTFASVLVGVPTVDEQVEMAAILSAIDRKIHLHQRKRAVVDEVFKSVLNKLMSGQVRAADLDLSALQAEKETVAA